MWPLNVTTLCINPFSSLFLYYWLTQITTWLERTGSDAHFHNICWSNHINSKITKNMRLPSDRYRILDQHFHRDQRGLGLMSSQPTHLKSVWETMLEYATINKQFNSAVLPTFSQKLHKLSHLLTGVIVLGLDLLFTPLPHSPAWWKMISVTEPLIWK